jgi:hypothetical protein
VLSREGDSPACNRNKMGTMTKPRPCLAAARSLSCPMTETGVEFARRSPCRPTMPRSTGRGAPRSERAVCGHASEAPALFGRGFVLGVA